MGLRQPFRLPTVLVVVAALATLRCDILNKLNGPGNLAIQSFTASPNSITSGSLTTLSWEVTGADSVEIDNGLGTVDAKGTRSIQLQWTTSFTLTAHKGTSASTSLVQVQVIPTHVGIFPSPSPLPSPSPSPGASPSPSPSATPTPGPRPTSCGTPSTWAQSCAVRVTYPTSLPEGQCIEINQVTVDRDCPLGADQIRNVQIQVTASTVLSTLAWRRGSQSADLLTPDSGTLSGAGTTTIKVQDQVGDSSMKFEVLDDQGNVIVRLTLSNL